MKEGKIKGKKWIIILSVLILIAIVVTLVIVFLPKNTDRVVELVDSQSKTMYLKNSDDKTKYKDFQNKINLNLSSSAKQEVENIYQLFISLNDVIDFYNQNLVFAQDNSVFQNNYNKVVRNLESANNVQKELNASIEKVNVSVGNLDIDFIRGIWKDFRQQFLNYYNYYIQAIDGLNEIYQGCMPKGVMQNDMTFLVLDNVDNYLQSIADTFVDTNASTNAKKIEFLQNFLGYIKNPEQIRQYKFSSSLQNQITVVKKFEGLYNSTYKSVVDSINATDFTFSAEVVDLENVLSTTILFLKGGIAA